MNQLRRRDFIGIYAPAAYLLFGFSALIVCSCIGTPNSTEISGPSGSDMVCVFYFGLHLIFWLPIGLLLVFLQLWRYRTPHAGPFYDWHRHMIGVALALVLLIFAFVSLKAEDGFLLILGICALVNVIPGLIFFGIGWLLTMKHREQALAGGQADQ